MLKTSQQAAETALGECQEAGQKLRNPSSNDYDTLHMPMSNDTAVCTGHYPWACNTSISHAFAKQCFQLFVPTPYLTMCLDVRTCCAGAVLYCRQLYAQQALLKTPILTLKWSMMAILLICPSPGDRLPSNTFTLCLAFMLLQMCKFIDVCCLHLHSEAC